MILRKDLEKMVRAKDLLFACAEAVRVKVLTFEEGEDQFHRRPIIRVRPGDHIWNVEPLHVLLGFRRGIVGGVVHQNE